MTRKTLLIVTIVALALLTVFGFLSTMHASTEPVPMPRATENLLRCGTCHTMEQEVQAWQAGAHASVACLQCHVEGDPGWIRHEFAEKNPEMEAAKAPHTIELKMDDQRCEQCHEPQMSQILKDIKPAPLNRPATGAPALMPVKAAHELHVDGKANLKCVDCHKVHSPAQGSADDRQEVHDRCQACHDQQKVQVRVTGSVSCSACHLDVAKVTPANHLPETAWQKEHGKAAADNTCGQCHLGASAGPHSEMTRPEAFSSAAGDTCAACHAGEPMPHPQGFLADHGVKAMTTGNNCAACHSEKSPITPAPDHAKPQFCADCHAGLAMPHPDAYLSAHGADALKAPEVCQTCHSASNPVKPSEVHASNRFCAECHANYQHPTGWVASHGGKADQGCTTCHSTASEHGGHTACASCHAKSGPWHPDMWFVSHGKEVLTEGKAGCMKCHNEVKPACTQCHRNP